MPLQITRNDITKMSVDAIVNAANTSLLGGGGVDGCIHRAAGLELLAECSTLHGCETGSTKITKGYHLPCKYVIHAVGPRWRDGKHREQELLQSCYRTSLNLAKENGCQSVAFPLISSGIYGYPKEQALRVAVDTISMFLMENEMMVYIVIFDKKANEMEHNYFNNLLKNSKTAKKQIALYLDEAKVERIDKIIKIFSSLSDSKSFSRNTLIEEAIDKFIGESEQFLYDEHGIDVERLLEEERAEKYDTVVFSSSGRGFEEKFLGESEPACWYPCKVSDSREGSLKYIAVYRGRLVSAITHYAKIKEFKYDSEKKCKVCYFDGDPIELPTKIRLGNKDSCFFIGTKYTSLESLLNASQADEVAFG